MKLLQLDSKILARNFYQKFIADSTSPDDVISVLNIVVTIFYSCCKKNNLNQFYDLTSVDESQVKEVIVSFFDDLIYEFNDLDEWCDYQLSKFGTIEKSGHINIYRLFYQMVRFISDTSKTLTENIDSLASFYSEIIYLIAKMKSKKDMGFYTHPSLAQLVAKLADVQDNMRVYDPVCGTGSLLISASCPKCTLYGQDISVSAWSIAKVNMLLNNKYNSYIYLGDSLYNPHISVSSVDRVVANPPFSLNLNKELQLDRDRAPYGTPVSKADYAFIQHALSSLKMNGKGVVVISPGVLFKGGNEKKIRKSLILDNYIKAVISLPSGMVYGTNISSSILIIEKNKLDNKIIFIDASDEFTVVNRQHQLSEKNISNILNWFYNFTEVPGKVSIMSIEEIENNDFDLTVSRYTFEEEIIEYKSINELYKQKTALEADLTVLQSEMKSIINEYMKL
ncbi:TPA: N-6 DNA methylase [Photobacterium damselae]